MPDRVVVTDEDRKEAREFIRRWGWERPHDAAALHESHVPALAYALAERGAAEREKGMRDILRDVSQFGGETPQIICRKIMNYRNIKGCTDPGPGYRCADTDCEYSDGRGCKFPVSPLPEQTGPPEDKV